LVVQVTLARCLLLAAVQSGHLAVAVSLLLAWLHLVPAASSRQRSLVHRTLGGSGTEHASRWSVGVADRYAGTVEVSGRGDGRGREGVSD